jgi:hypothetical protein
MQGQSAAAKCAIWSAWAFAKPGDGAILTDAAQG